MNENRKINSHDEGLRRAIARRELQLPHMPDDLNQRLMQRMGQRKAIAKKRWLATVAASVAVVAFVAVLIGGWLELPSKQNVNVVAQEGRQYETKATNKVIAKQKAATSVVRQAEKQTSPQENSIKAESKFSKEKITSVREEQKGASISDSVRLTEAQKVMDQARVSIEQQQKQAEQQFRNQVSEFALDIAQKVVKKQMADPKAQSQLVNSYLDEIEKNN